VVATSGGALPAAYWTALCLTEFERQWPEFPYRVRIITGASGGMLGAAAFVAGLPPPGDISRRDRLGTIPRLMEQDFLTPVVRRMALRDLPSIFCPADQSNDRGRVLEATWATRTDGLLGRSLAALADGEARGWRPSLIFSPMIIEEGRPLLISNLDLGGLSGGLELAQIFPAATRFRLSTAVRMSAAFPYVSPAASLPTTPPRRVVDAGYLDNYGVGLATSWIDLNRDWLLLNTSGVVFIQLRAYTPPEPTTMEPTIAERIASAFEPFTAPLAGHFSAKDHLLQERNDQRIKALSDTLNDPGKGGREGFFRTVVLSPPHEAQVPMSWVLTSEDGARMRDGLRWRTSDIREIVQEARAREAAIRDLGVE
jgi:hypothetical protein